MSEKSLEQVLQELKDAEKEYKEKCLKYGIEEKKKRKKEGEEDAPIGENQEENSQSETSES